VSRCEQPPRSQTRITAVFPEADRPLFSARRRSSPGQLKLANPVSPIRMNPRRLKGPAQESADGIFEHEDISIF
jgi:hypothetical protein